MTARMVEAIGSLEKVAKQRRKRRRIDMKEQVISQAPADAVGYRLVLPGTRLDQRAVFLPSRRSDGSRAWYRFSPFDYPDDIRLRDGHSYRIVWVDRAGQPVAPCAEAPVPGLFFFVGDPLDSERAEELLDDAVRLAKGTPSEDRAVQAAVEHRISMARNQTSQSELQRMMTQSQLQILKMTETTQKMAAASEAMTKSVEKAKAQTESDPWKTVAVAAAIAVPSLTALFLGGRQLGQWVRENREPRPDNPNPGADNEWTLGELWQAANRRWPSLGPVLETWATQQAAAAQSASRQVTSQATASDAALAAPSSMPALKAPSQPVRSAPAAPSAPRPSDTSGAAQKLSAGMTDKVPPVPVAPVSSVAGPPLLDADARHYARSLVTVITDAEQCLQLRYEYERLGASQTEPPIEPRTSLSDEQRKTLRKLASDPLWVAHYERLQAVFNEAVGSGFEALNVLPFPFESIPQHELLKIREFYGSHTKCKEYLEYRILELSAILNKQAPPKEPSLGLADDIKCTIRKHTIDRRLFMFVLELFRNPAEGLAKPAT